ncbi:MAG: non-ribosomal peptide synthetase, partial [bacterium]|nr:non-ribosomal peptide synthetase [bacterium]
AVAVIMEPSPQMIVGILGILAAGGAYLPINPTYPRQRKRSLLEDADAALLLTDQNDTTYFQGETMHPTHYAITPTVPHHHNGENSLINTPLNRQNDPPQDHRPSHDPAYIIYTSGSTGKPKGVMVEHRSVVRLVKNTNFIRFQPGDRIMQTGALEFDASTFEIWGALLNGLQLYLAGRETILTPAKLKHTLSKYKISTIWMTAPLFNRMVDEDIDIFKGLRHILAGGDALSPPHINRVRRHFLHLAIINGYGPTENTTFSTTFSIPTPREVEGTKKYNVSIPIGSPIANSTAYVVDGFLNPLPIGVPGELVVGGHGVARGYLNDPQLTAEKFVPFPAAMNSTGHPGSVPRIYKTGDLVRLHRDGYLEFIGRIDQQTKIRGFRVEMGEIEHHLLRHPRIKQAVAMVRNRGDNDKYICAYIVPSSPPPQPPSHGVGVPSNQEALPTIDSAAFQADLHNFLSQRLPDYMIPSQAVLLEQLPLTTNGKVDRAALPEPDSTDATRQYVQPANDTEKQLTGIWSEVLDIEADQISTNDDFFSLGGHSLAATSVVSRIHKIFHVKIPLAEIFTSPTIHQLAQFLLTASRQSFISIEPAEKKE